MSSDTREPRFQNAVNNLSPQIEENVINPSDKDAPFCNQENTDKTKSHDLYAVNYMENTDTSRDSKCGDVASEHRGNHKSLEGSTSNESDKESIVERISTVNNYEVPATESTSTVNNYEVPTSKDEMNRLLSNNCSETEKEVSQTHGIVSFGLYSSGNADLSADESCGMGKQSDLQWQISIDGSDSEISVMSPLGDTLIRNGDELYMGEMPPCDCDECLLGESSCNDPGRVAPKMLTKRQSSWQKIRNIVQWAPFIQQFKKRRYPWIQLAGHQGNFQAGEQGSVLKKYDKGEQVAISKLMKDSLRPYVPEYKGEIEKNGERYIQLQDLLSDFESPCVMDVKMGTRTYLEEELTKAMQKPTLRKDMYKKMLEVDPTAPTREEHAQGAITKPRYMQWRDEMSSSVELGFRIEGIMKSNEESEKNFKTTKSRESIIRKLQNFIDYDETVMKMYLSRLKALRLTQETSPFFKSHEIIGSSLLFVHDKSGQACVWMIDFGKTVPLSENMTVDHRSKWKEGNHEDGYLCGIDNLISLFEKMCDAISDNSSQSVLNSS
ncbi:hypothetical protein CHS0354_020186 [Potamilus streckersoni]|uniref:Kinase n=1 Tax=Potamilus streckersoni TaxID=2493646 RepID=A0AAE0SKA8_9BIVA|nr:hypothetical protein CHS0354_020186 [Potamilus streckersoni]